MSGILHVLHTLHAGSHSLSELRNYSSQRKEGCVTRQGLALSLGQACGVLEVVRNATWWRTAQSCVHAHWHLCQLDSDCRRCCTMLVICLTTVTQLLGRAQVCCCSSFEQSGGWCMGRRQPLQPTIIHVCHKPMLLVVLSSYLSALLLPHGATLLLLCLTLCCCHI